MSVSDDSTYFLSYDGNGSTTAFSWANNLLEKSHLAVYLYDESDGTKALQTLDTDYTVQIDTGNLSATVNMTTAPAITEKLRIEYNVPFTQESDYRNYQISSRSIEAAFDKTALQNMTQQVELDRSVKFTGGESVDATLPNPYGKDGQAIILVDDGDDTWSLDYANVTSSAVYNSADPDSSTDNAVVRWDGVTGLAVQDSSVTINDAGLITANSLNVTPGNTTLSNLTATTADINDGTIDDVDIGLTTAAAANFTSIGDTTTGTGSFTTLNATGLTTLANVDINGDGLGAIDGTVIGASSAANGTFDAITGTSIDIDGNVITDVNVSTSLTGAANTTLASSLAIKTYVDDQIGSNNSLHEIYTNDTSVPHITPTTAGSVPFTIEAAEAVDDTAVQFQVRNSSQATTFSVIGDGSVKIGDDDITQGILDIYGDSNVAGGTLHLHQGANEDAVNEYARIRADDGGLNIELFSGGLPTSVADFDSAGVFTAKKGLQVAGGDIQLNPATFDLYITQSSTRDPLIRYEQSGSGIDWVAGYDDSANAFSIENDSTFAGSPAFTLADSTGDATFTGDVTVDNSAYVLGGLAKQTTTDTNADDLIVGATTGNHGISIVAPNGVASLNFEPNNGTFIRYDENTNNDLEFKVNGGIALTIDSSQNVNIEKDLIVDGQITGDDGFHITNIDTTGVLFESNLAGGNVVIDPNSGWSGGAAHSNADHFAIQHSTSHVGMSILSSATGDCHIYMGDDTSGTRGRITYSNNGDTLKLFAGSGKAVEFDSNLDATFYGDITLGASGVNKVWTKYIPASAMEPYVTAFGGPAVYHYENNELSIQTLAFDQTTLELCGFCVDLGDDYDGSAIVIKFYWTAESGTGTVDWRVESMVFGDNDPLGASISSTHSVVDTLIATDDFHEAQDGGTPNRPGTGTILYGRLRRNASSDTLNADALLIGIGISYS